MHSEVKLSLIVARGRNNVIGVAGQLPWRLKSDMMFFKRVTMDHPIIMGRKTWESLPKHPLPGRENIVMTRDWTYDAPGARVYSSFPAAMNAAKAVAKRTGKREVFVIGGEAIYTLALPLADRVYLTDVDAAPEGDAYFPPLDAQEWHESTAEAFGVGDGNNHAFTIRQLDRVHASATSTRP
ncbi:dihydrofolate reductase [Hyphomonas johnsonii]|uniref:Dihydrofolate reductase n=1 Tax=Hyphomonas johnsonii MHS-2 TaxID=1280950 RepID=A0A059FQ58_9PROT|nr:dihydrofolate reductase [Hyphomonas johnsonii]KCZ92815.1 dihydrofolate reductase [Hyphomonas johnsonii MHS-2]